MKKTGHKKRVLQIVMNVALVGFIICAGILIYYGYSVKKSQKIYGELSQEYVQEEMQSTQVETASTEVLEYVSPIDFEQLQKKENEDIYAWIKINNTVIDYPVLQHPEDDSYYLTHSIDGSYGYPGCIYTELFNTKTFEDPVTVLYGHYMKDGSMFTDLHKFMDRDFFEQNGEIIIYTPDREIHYQVFAAVHTDNKRILVWNNFEHEDNVASFLEEIMNTPETSTDHIRSDVELSAQGHYIVMQTCVDESADVRYTVMAVEI